MTQIVLRKFDPSSIKDGRICVIIGKRGTGKTILGKDLLYHQRHLASGICCSGTEDGNMFYQKFIPDLFVYNELDLAAIGRLVSRQKDLCKKDIHDPVFLVLDDCMYERNVFREKLVRQIFYNGRHYGIATLLNMQYCLDLPPDLRTNIDYVFILRENIRANRERLWKSFGGIFHTFDQFNAVMDSVTEDYGCLVIDNTSKSNKIEDVAFWYKANPSRHFRMGSAALWRYHDAKYDAKWEEKRDPFTPVRRKSSVKVLKSRRPTKRTDG